MHPSAAATDPASKTSYLKFMLSLGPDYPRVTVSTITGSGTFTIDLIQCTSVLVSGS